MVDKEKLAQAEEKIRFAEYLMRSTGSESYNAGAVKHIMNASKLAIQALTDVGLDSPRAMQLALLKFEEPEARQFAKSFVSAWRQASDDSAVDRIAAKMALRNVTDFIDWIKKEQMDKA